MPNHQFLLAIDQGTTGSTSLVIDVSEPHHPIVIGKATSDFEQFYPQNAWVEHDLDQVWLSVETAVNNACALAEQKNKNFSKKNITAIGITNQRETLCFFNRNSGRPERRAIVWQCKRSEEICSRLKNQGLENEVRNKTGLVLDPYFSGTKLTWVLENEPDLARKISDKQALVGTIDSWLMYQLSGTNSFVTEASNASRTLLFNINKGSWDSELLEMLGVPSVDVLPEVRDSASHFAVTKGVSFLPDGIPITGVLGDQQAALAGQACFEKGSGKCTYGTGAFLLVNQGETPVLSNHGLLTTVAWSLKGKLTYAFEGSAFIAGASMQFLRDQMGFLSSAEQSAAMAENSTAAPDLYFVPALAGLGAPYWDSQARGAFLGLTRGTTKNQLVRAGLEGIAFQVCDLVDAINSELGSKVEVLNVDGGACANNLLMQIQSNYGQLKIDRPENLETTAFGAAMMAGLGVGLYQNLADVSAARVTDRQFIPQNDSQGEKERQMALAGWHKAVKSVQVFAQS